MRGFQRDSEDRGVSEGVSRRMRGVRGGSEGVRGGSEGVRGGPREVRGKSERGVQKGVR